MQGSFIRGAYLLCFGIPIVAAKRYAPTRFDHTSAGIRGSNCDPVRELPPAVLLTQATGGSSLAKRCGTVRNIRPLLPLLGDPKSIRGRDWVELRVAPQPEVNARRHQLRCRHWQTGRG